MIAHICIIQSFKSEKYKGYKIHDFKQKKRIKVYIESEMFIPPIFL